MKPGEPGDLCGLDYERLSAELMRSLRGRRSQEGLARRLQRRSHAIYTWEAARNFPTAALMFEVAEKSGIDVRGGLSRFYRRPPAFLDSADLTTAADVAWLLEDLRGKTPITQLARAAGRSRYAVARWLKGSAQPRLPDFLRLVDAASLRLVEFVGCLVDPEGLPSIRAQHQALAAMRRAAYERPWSHAFLRGLELADYRALGSHRPGWLAARLGLPLDEEGASLELLEASGQIQRVDGLYRAKEAAVIDTRQDATRARALRHFFSRAAADRLANADEALASSAFNLFGVSRQDLERLKTLQRAYFREMRTIIAQSQPVEAVVLANMQLVELAGVVDAPSDPPPVTDPDPGGTQPVGRDDSR